MDYAYFQLGFEAFENGFGVDDRRKCIASNEPRNIQCWIDGWNQAKDQAS